LFRAFQNLKACFFLKTPLPDRATRRRGLNFNAAAWECARGTNIGVRFMTWI
jgi:hypothetical protein